MIVKRNIPFPFVGALGITGVSVPGTSQKYATGSRFSSGAAFSPDPGVISLSTAAQKISLPRDPRGVDGAKLRAITLAPDSAYSTCDIWTKVDGSVEAVRCDIQNPVMMGPDIADQADIYVTVPNLIPPVIPAVGVQMWDANFLTDASNVNGLWCAPLRLYFWYDEVPMNAPSQRPMLHARGRVSNLAATTSSFFVPVEGRRAILLRVNFGTANANAHIFGWYGRAGNTAPNIEGSVQGTSSIQLDFIENTDVPTTSPPSGAAVGTFTTTNKPEFAGCPLLELRHTTGVTPDAAAGVTFDLFAWDSP